MSGWLKERDAEAQAKRHFEEAMADHEMKVLHDEGLYRHLRFQSPGTWIYGYDLITWPGCLTIEGDINPSGITFARVKDMLDFFMSGPSINPGYWAEKITNPAAREATMRYSEEKLNARVDEALGGKTTLWREHAQLYDLTVEHEAHRALHSFDHEGFCDAWEWDLREWDHIFLMVCWAIRAGVGQYVEATPQVVAA